MLSFNSRFTLSSYSIVANRFVPYTHDRCFMLVSLLNQDVKTGPFMDFEVKKNMRIAPSCRVPGLDVVHMAEHLDEQIACQVMSCC